MQQRPTSGSGLIKRYVFWVGAGAAFALALSSLGQDWSVSPKLLNGLIAILAVGLAAELSSMSVSVGSSLISIAFIPYLGAAFLFPPALAMSVVGLTVFVVEALVRRKPWIKIIFNTAKEVLAVGLGGAVYVLLGGRPSVSEFQYTIPAVLGAGVAYSAANSVAVSLAVSLTEGPGFGEAWLGIYGGSMVYDLFATPIPAVLAYLYVRWELGGLVALTVPLFIVRHIYVQNLRLEQSNRELLDLMVKQVELVEPYTSGHSKRVAHYARTLAKEAGIHGITSLRGPVEKSVRHHHENFDGTGYPDGLAGEGIPIGARIIMIADTLDAMTTDRPYRSALPFERVLDEVRRHSGRQFDPQLAELVVRSPAIRRLVAAQTRSVAESEQLASSTPHHLRSVERERAAV